MPKPFKGRRASALQFRTYDLVRHHIGNVACIGAIAMQWSRVEAILAYLYTLLVFGERELTDIGESIAAESLEVARSFQEKQHLLLAATAKRVGAKTSERMKKPLKSLQDAHMSRNGIIHGRWALSDDKPPLLVLYDRIASRKPPMVYELEDFHRVLNAISRAESEFSKLWTTEIAPHLKPPTIDWAKIVEAAVRQEAKSGG